MAEDETQNQSFPSDTSQLKIEDRVGMLEKQMLIIHYQQQRLVSDATSEKGTRSRLNESMLVGIKELEKRVRLLEKAIWSGIGIVIFVEFLIKSKLIP
jgi:hypothetical protein